MWCVALLVGTTPAAAPLAPPQPAPVAIHAAIGAVGTLSSGLTLAIGTVQKHPGFLFNQTEPWEHNVNNGYPNVVYSPG
jgi:hypothetical protein